MSDFSIEVRLEKIEKRQAQIERKLKDLRRGLDLINAWFSDRYSELNSTCQFHYGLISETTGSVDLICDYLVELENCLRKLQGIDPGKHVYAYSPCIKIH